jgi:hypothetical protein
MYVGDGSFARYLQSVSCPNRLQAVLRAADVKDAAEEDSAYVDYKGVS